MLFGVNDFPQVMCVEDFSPYWVTDAWTESRQVTDLRIMKSIGCSCYRLSLYPALPEKGEFTGIAPEKYVPMLDLIVDTCEDLGLRLLLDIDQGVEEHGEEGVRFLLDRYRGRIEAYQIGNERYDFPRDDGKLRWMQGLAELAHSLDPEAKISADMFVPDWVRVRDGMPELYQQLDMALAHYYSVTDYRGWDDVYLADLLDHLGNPSGRESLEVILSGAKNLDPEKQILRSAQNDGEGSAQNDESAGYDAKTQSFDHPFYAGSWAWIGKEVWLTELASHGYWRWGALVDEEKRADDWRRVVGAVADAQNPVTRIYHHAFRDKMTWREFGRDQSGIVKYDGSPRPVTWAFRDMAAKLAPPESPLHALECEIERVVVSEGADEIELRVKLTNKTGSPFEAQVALVGAKDWDHGLSFPPQGSSSQSFAPTLSVPPNGSSEWRVLVDVSRLPVGNNHVFARVTIPQGLVNGWGVIARPGRVEIDPASNLPELSDRVRYVQGIEAVQAFVDEYGDRCAIITGPALGSDTECGYRLKIVLESVRCTHIAIRNSLLCEPLLGRPLIVVGSPEWNLIARAIEMTLPEDRRVGGLNAGMGMIQVVEQPFGERSIAGRLSPQAEAIGYYFGSCPAALYIAGPDDAGTQAATYDLILRTWRRGRSGQ